MEKRKNDDQFSEDRCPVCGDNRFEWGKLHTRGENSRIGFKPQDAGFMVGSMNVDARHCMTCGNVLLFTKED
ncbi:MAG: hypothetical protein KC615_04500 [Anaerolineae bacterium]|nr:hypothetical protein [Anaerolineae bacterium]